MRSPILCSDKSMTTVYVGKLALYFSYATLVAFRSPRMIAAQRNRWGSATGKAINLAIRENEDRKSCIYHLECEEKEFVAYLETELKEGIV